MDERIERIIDKTKRLVKWRNILTYYKYKQIAIELAQYDIPETVIMRVLKSAYDAVSTETNHD